MAFCAPDERKLLGQIERLMGIEIPVAGGDGSESEIAPPKVRQRAKGRSTGHLNADGTPKKKRTSRRSPQAKRGEAVQPNKKHPRRGGTSAPGRGAHPDAAQPKKATPATKPRRQGGKDAQPNPDQAGRAKNSGKGRRSKPRRWQRGGRGGGGGRGQQGG